MGAGKAQRGSGADVFMDDVDGDVDVDFDVMDIASAVLSSTSTDVGVSVDVLMRKWIGTRAECPICPSLPAL